MKRPELNRCLDAAVFSDYYYLKEELVSFCKQENLPTSGNKEVLTRRVATYLAGDVLNSQKSLSCVGDSMQDKMYQSCDLVTNSTNQLESHTNKSQQQKLDKGGRTVEIKQGNPIITLESLIEPNFVCSQCHRTFFTQQIGSSFHFQVAFQNWLKTNTGKTYADAINAYHDLQKNKKTTQTKIGKQFEYNRYIRDFFADNQGLSLQQAIICWNAKKVKPGVHVYEREDLNALR